MSSTANEPQPVTITVCPNGPLIVRGDVQFLGADGAVIDAGRETVALCRCGRSGRAPFCDGSHKLRRRGAPDDTA